MTTALLKQPDTRVVTTDEVTLVKNTVAAGATDAELKLFLFDCARRGVHPLDRLLHFTKRGGRYTPVTSIDFMRSQAAASGEMAGSDDPKFEFVNEVHPDAATVTVYRIAQGQRFAYTATARWSEYCPDNAPMWKRMPHTMLGKCAEALALRKAFPQQLAGLYSREEMDQADTVAPAPVMRPDPPQAVLDTATGEIVPAAEKPAPPDGFVYIADCTKDTGGWYHIFLPDASGGNRFELKTKLEKVGEVALDAYQQGLPVKVACKKSPWLDAVHVWKPEAKAGNSGPLTADEIVF